MASSILRLALTVIFTFTLSSANANQSLYPSLSTSTSFHQTHNDGPDNLSNTSPSDQFISSSSTNTTDDEPTQTSQRERREVSPQEQTAQSSAPKQQSMRQARSGPSPDQALNWPPNRPNPYDFELDESANLPPLIRAHYAPKADFVTSGRPRALFFDSNGSRESRELLPLARAYEAEYEQRLMQQEQQQRQQQAPVIRNSVSEHDIEVPIPRSNYNSYYPERYRSQRDYYYRSAPGGSVANSYMFNRFHDEEQNYEVLGGYRPTPRTKRIIYYATLPEKKPMSDRPYSRPHNPRVSEGQMEMDRKRVPAMNNFDLAGRPMRYPFDNPGYDNYVKRSSFYDRKRPTYEVGDPRFGERPTFKDRMRSDDRKIDTQMSRSAEDQRLPWPVQIGTEVNIKENERIPGRKIFGQSGTQYDRYEGSRVKKTLETVERKEDADENHHDDNDEDQRNQNYSSQ